LIVSVRVHSFILFSKNLRTNDHYVRLSRSSFVARELENRTGQTQDWRRRKSELHAELANLVEAVAKSGYHSPLVMKQIAERERELSKVTQWLSGSDPHHVERYLGDVRQFVESRFSQIGSLLYANVERARAELSRHVDRIDYDASRKRRQTVLHGFR
jgi:hypothetical protein